MVMVTMNMDMESMDLMVIVIMEIQKDMIIPLLITVMKKSTLRKIIEVGSDA
jgi:hypothetical protein